MKTVYIAGPYTVGDVGENVGRAMDMAQNIISWGHDADCPHLFHFLHLTEPRKYSVWISICLHRVARADCVYRLPVRCAGADAEVAEAVRLGIPVFSDRESLVLFLHGSTVKL